MRGRELVSRIGGAVLLGAVAALSGFLVIQLMGCAANRALVKTYDANTGKRTGVSVTSSLVIGGGVTEMTQKSPTGGTSHMSTSGTGITKNAANLGLAGMKLGMAIANPAGATIEALTGDDEPASDGDPPTE